MINVFSGSIRDNLIQQAEKLGVKGKGTIDILATTRKTILEVLQSELKNDKYNEVLAFLKSTSLIAGRNLLYNKIIQRVVSRLVLRFGLPYALALNVASLLVPFILNRLGRKALKSGKVQDIFSTLGITDRLDELSILKKQLKHKFTFNQAAE